MSLAAISGVGYVVLPCDDLARARRFYAEVMGFAPDHDSATGVSFRVGATRLSLRLRGRSPAGDDDAAQGPAAIQLAFRVTLAALAGCHAELVAKGVAILRGPEDLPAWRHRAIVFRDPEQNLIEIYAEY